MTKVSRLSRNNILQFIRGFTLIEFLIVVVIMGIISVVIGRVLFAGYENFNTAQNISEIDWNGLLALERLANDIHKIDYGGDISTMQNGQLVFIDQSGAQINYQLTDEKLLRNNIQLINGIQSFSMNFLDKDGASTALNTDVRYISISLTIASKNNSASFETLVATRGTT